MNRRNFLLGLFTLPVIGVLDKITPKIRTQRLQQGIVNAWIDKGALRIHRPFVRRKIQQTFIDDTYTALQASDEAYKTRNRQNRLWRILGRNKDQT